MNKPWVTWLLVYLGLLGAAVAFYFLAPISGLPGLVRAVAIGMSVVATGGHVVLGGVCACGKQCGGDKQNNGRSHNWHPMNATR